MARKTQARKSNAQNSNRDSRDHNVLPSNGPRLPNGTDEPFVMGAKVGRELAERFKKKLR